MKKFLLLLFLGAVIVVLANLAAYYFGPASWTGWWVASIFHFLGGVYAFFFVRSLYRLTEKRHKTTTVFLFKIIIFAGGALVLGVIWEWYEFIFIYNYGALARSQLTITTYSDTITDLMFDLLGALSSSVYLIVKNGKNK